MNGPTERVQEMESFLFVLWTLWAHLYSIFCNSLARFSFWFSVMNTWRTCRTLLACWHPLPRSYSTPNNVEAADPRLSGVGRGDKDLNLLLEVVDQPTVAYTRHER